MPCIFIFFICIEILSNCFAKCPEITGLNINNNTIKQTLFADDATFFNDGNETSFNKLISTLEQFGTSSGLKINYSKTIIFQVGCLKNKHINFSKNSRFTWTSSSAKTLGITFTNNSTQYILDNFIPKVLEFKTMATQKINTNGKSNSYKILRTPKISSSIYCSSKPTK